MNTIPVRPLLTLKLAMLAAAAVLMLLVSGCHWGVHGNGRVITETRPVSNFTKLEADGAFTITWSPGSPSLKITTDSNLMEYIRSESSGDRLHLEWIKPLQGTHGIKVVVSAPALTHVTLNGATRLTASDLAGSEFYLDGNGATRATLSGKVNAMAGELNGAGRLDAEQLTTRAMELSISGAGRADVSVSDVLKVDISGAGKVTYSGSPTISKNISGAGNVVKRD